MPKEKTTLYPRLKEADEKQNYESWKRLDYAY